MLRPPSVRSTDDAWGRRAWSTSTTPATVSIGASDAAPRRLTAERMMPRPDTSARSLRTTPGPRLTRCTQRSTTFGAVTTFPGPWCAGSSRSVAPNARCGPSAVDALGSDGFPYGAVSRARCRIRRWAERRCHSTAGVSRGVLLTCGEKPPLPCHAAWKRLTSRTAPWPSTASAEPKGPESRHLGRFGASR